MLTSAAGRSTPAARPAPVASPSKTSQRWRRTAGRSVCVATREVLAIDRPSKPKGSQAGANISCICRSGELGEVRFAFLEEGGEGFLGFCAGQHRPELRAFHV